MTLALFFQLVACATTFIAMWLMGNKSVHGPAWGLVSQFAWAAMIVSNGVWGLAPVTAAMTFIHARNLVKWRNETAA